METKLPKLSASKLKLYQQCPKMYKYKYRDDTKGEFNIYGIIGSAAHKAIERHYTEGASIAQTFMERVDKWVTAEVQGVENTGKVIESIYPGLVLFNPALYIPKEVEGKKQIERYFNLPYPNIEAPICTINGYMDFITDTHVIDWKTGKDKVTKKSVEKDLQFVIYSWAYEQLYGYAPTGVVYYRIRDNKPVEGNNFDRTELDTVIRALLDDPFEYDAIPCDNCALWCPVRQAYSRQTDKLLRE